MSSIPTRIRVIAYCPAMEVLRHTQDQSIILRDAFRLVSPFPCDLHGCLDCFGSSVHWQDHFKAEEFGNKFGKLGEYIVVEGSRAQRQPRCLLSQGFDQFWMAVPLVDSTISREKIEISTQFQ